MFRMIICEYERSLKRKGSGGLCRPNKRELVSKNENKKTKKQKQKNKKIKKQKQKNKKQKTKK
jgi:hypothetical protein